MTNGQKWSVEASHSASVDCFGLFTGGKQAFRAGKAAKMMAGGGLSCDVGWKIFAGEVVVRNVGANGLRLTENGWRTPVNFIPHSPIKKFK